MTKILFEETPKGVGELLAEKLGDNYIGASTAKIRGWSSISNYMICDRMFYYKSVKKYRPQSFSPALDIGILFHECLAAHYATGGKRTFDPLEALSTERPEIAHEVKRLLYAYFAEHLKTEVDTWDVRAVEREIIGTVEYRGKTAPAYSRLDLLIRKKTADQECLPYGPCPDGVYIVDHKAVGRLTKDLTEGYKMDGQFLLMAHLWKQQNFDAIYGPLKGFIINIVTKTKEVQCKRLEIDIQEDDMSRFAETMSPVIVELHSRMNDKDEIADEKNWPMNFAACKNPKGYGTCEFFDMCVSHGKLAGLYQIGVKK